MVHDVFISYSTRNTEFAETVCEKLEENGIECWIAPRNIKTGANYAQEIIDGLNAARVVVLVFSKDAQESKYVNQEIDTAFKTNKRIVAFKVDEALPEGEMKFYLKNTQWLDASSEALENQNMTLDESYNQLVESVKRTCADWKPDGQCKKCHRMFYIDQEFKNDSESLEKYNSTGLCKKCQIDKGDQGNKTFMQRYGLPIAAIVIVLIAISGFMLFNGSGDADDAANKTGITIGYIELSDYGDGSYIYSVFGSLSQDLLNSTKNVVHIDYLDKSGKVVDTSDTKVGDIEGNTLGSITVNKKTVKKVSVELKDKKGKVLYSAKSDNILEQ